MFKALCGQLSDRNACAARPKVKLCLATGRITSDANRIKLRSLFKQKGWLLFDEEWLYEGLGKISNDGYENSETAIVSKLVNRRKIA